jgi:hypothetical protein
MASEEGDPHVWARDNVITSLGALLSPEEIVVAILAGIIAVRRGGKCRSHSR